MPIRTRFLRRLALGLVVTGLVIGLAGEVLVIDNDVVRLSQDNPGWPVVGFGAAIAAVGLLLLGLRPLYARLPRRRTDLTRH